MAPSPPHFRPKPANPDEDPGVPWFRSWRAVYVFVLVTFVVVVVALGIFSHVFA